MQRRLATGFAIAGLVILLSLSAKVMSGQVITGTLQGSVLDSSGAVIPNANVTATNEGTGISSKMTTSAQGFYTFPTLAPGPYSVTVSAPGFKTTIAKGNLVQVEQATRLDITLAAGQVNQEVTVTGATPLVETTTSDLGTTIDAQQINDLPVNGRLFQTLMQLAPGTTPSGWGDQIENPSAAGSTALGTGGSGNMTSVNGFPFEGNLYLVDGVNDVEPQNAYINVAIPFTDIAEMKMETSNPSAEYGTFGGAVVNLTTKTGTNSFHGQLFEFNRNTDYNSSDHFSHLNPASHVNQFGGEFEGPITRDKLFFSGDFQELLQHAGSSAIWSVPTAAMRTGNLSAFDTTSSGPPITNPAACTMIATANGAANPQPCTASAQAAGSGKYDTIPQGDISAIAAAFLSPSVIPLPNMTGTNNGTANNFAYTALIIETMPQFDARVDYALSAKDRFFARNSYAHRNYSQPSPGTPFMSTGNNSNGTNSSYNDVVGWDHFFSSNMINQARVGFSRYATTDFDNNFGTEENNILGIPNGNITTLPMTSGIAQTNFSNGWAGTGDPGFVPNGLGRLANIYQYIDTFTLIHGQHSLKFGADAQRLQTSVRNAQNDPRGQFFFNGSYTGAGTSGSTIGDFLVGAPDQVSRDLFPSTPATRVTFFGVFAQDDIRVNQKLTLNLGVRWDVYTAPVDAHNNQSNFVASGPSAGLIQIASSSNRGPNVDTYFGNFAPRVGMAYTPDNGKTALRAAFGISYFPDNFGSDGGTLERNFPELLLENNFGSSNCLTPVTPSPEFSGCGSLVLANGLPGITAGQVYSPLIQPAVTPGGFVSPPAGFGVFNVANNFRQDEAQSWNVSVERQLTPSMSIHVAYVGNAGKHLYRDDQINQCPPSSFSAATTPPAYPACLPFNSINPNITTVDFRNSGHSSHYNSGQLELDRRAARGLTLMAAYTWSKMMDNINNPISPTDLHQELDTVGFQRNNFPQVLTFSYVYELPFGRNKQWLGSVSPLENALVGGWGVSGITNFRSGAPLLITASSSGLLPQNQGQRANYVCGVPDNPHTISQWIDTSCWAQPQGFVFGNAGVGEGGAYGPRYQDWDFSVNKAVRFGEDGRMALRFQATFTNVFNHVNLQPPDTNQPDGNFGVITSDFLPRQGQLGMTFSF